MFQVLSDSQYMCVCVSQCKDPSVTVSPPPEVCLPPSMTSVDLLQSGECVHC